VIVENLFKQSTAEWEEAKMGVPSASSFAKILTATGKKPSASVRNGYMYKLAGERVTGRKDDTFYGKAMRRGHELEPQARSFFAFRAGVEVETPALCYRDARKLYLCSPDGLILGKMEGLEIKCPELSASVKYIEENRLPNDYIPQVQGSLMVTGYDAWHFMSYCPGLKSFILSVEPDYSYIALQEEAVEEFCHDLAQLIERIRP